MSKKSRAREKDDFIKDLTLVSATLTGASISLTSILLIIAYKLFEVSYFWSFFWIDISHKAILSSIFFASSSIVGFIRRYVSKIWRNKRLSKILYYIFFIPFSLGWIMIFYILFVLFMETFIVA